MRDYFYAYVPRQAKQGSWYGLFVNQAGQPHPALRLAGLTFAVNPEGKALVETANEAEQVLYVDLP
jgi:predicted amidohydrolase